MTKLEECVLYLLREESRRITSYYPSYRPYPPLRLLRVTGTTEADILERELLKDIHCRENTDT